MGFELIRGKPCRDWMVLFIMLIQYHAMIHNSESQNVLSLRGPTGISKFNSV